MSTAQIFDPAPILFETTSAASSVIRISSSSRDTTWWPYNAASVTLEVYLRKVLGRCIQTNHGSALQKSLLNVEFAGRQIEEQLPSAILHGRLVEGDDCVAEGLLHYYTLPPHSLRIIPADECQLNGMSRVETAGHEGSQCIFRRITH